MTNAKNIYIQRTNGLFRCFALTLFVVYVRCCNSYKCAIDLVLPFAHNCINHAVGSFCSLHLGMKNNYCTCMAVGSLAEENQLCVTMSFPTVIMESRLASNFHFAFFSTDFLTNNYVTKKKLVVLRYFTWHVLWSSISAGISETIPQLFRLSENRERTIWTFLSLLDRFMLWSVIFAHLSVLAALQVCLYVLLDLV